MFQPIQKKGQTFKNGKPKQIFVRGSGKKLKVSVNDLISDYY